MEHNGIYNNKYRIPSTRLQNWDYGWNAIYFVTICTKDRNHYFGEMKNGEMQLLPIGAIADVLWHELNNHFDNIELDAFVVMPNHIHGIIAINNDGGNVETTRAATTTHAVETTHALSLQPQPPKTIGQRRFQHQGSGTLSSIVGAYKSAVSRHVHRLGYEFAWQPRFYDRIISNNDALTRVQTYIVNNPLNWKEDKFYNQ